MAQEHTSEHGDGGHGGEVHLPDPNSWPLIAGLAAFLVGIALVWWMHDSGNRDLAGPFLGAAIVVALLAGAGWAYEDARTRRKAASGDTSDEPVRRTQVITFAIAEGQLDAADGAEGVIRALEDAHDDLQGTPGFEDLRLNVSRAATGPSQVIVETTWSGPEELAAYDATQRTLLDVIDRHGDEVLTGSVQAFDMQVVRDTKEVSVRFGMGAATAVLGAFIVGGFALGAGLTLFESEGEGGGGTGPVDGGNSGGATFQGTVTARNILFDFEEITLPPGIEYTMVMDNQDQVPHNIAFYQDSVAELGAPFLEGCISGCENGAAIRTAIESGPVLQEFTFTTPGPGRYGFLCEVHPDTMVGVLIIEEGAPLPGEEAPAAEEPAEGGGAGDESGEAAEGEDDHG